MTPMRILIVEDEQIIAVDLRRRLGRMGHVGVGIVTSGEEAIVGPNDSSLTSYSSRLVI